MFNGVFNTGILLIFNDCPKVSLVLIGHKRHSHDDVEMVLGLLLQVR